MGYPTGNKQTPYIGYPQNQLFTPQDQQYIQDTQQDFLNWGQWQPGMTKVSQWITDPALTDPTNPSAQSFLGAEQQKLDDYYTRVGTPYEQSQRQAYWQQMGGQVYGGIIPDPSKTAMPGTPEYNKLRQPPEDPWGTLNSMGVSSAYAMPAWQQDYFTGQNAGPGQPNNFEQFSLYPQGPGANQALKNAISQVPGMFDPPPGYQAPQAQDPQSNWANWPTPWGSSNTDNAWGNGKGWGQ